MKMKKTRCKDGELALVIHDIPECAENIGRIVLLSGPLTLNREHRKQCWLVEPVVKRLYAFECEGAVRRRVVLFRDLVEHPDDWLMPIGRDPEFSKGNARRSRRPREPKIVTVGSWMET
jgi:hypothetical protein